MRIIPVIDLLGSQVVRGVAGQREQYRPLKSRLVDGSDPAEVARAIHRDFGLSQFYLADLDAILDRRPNRPILESLCANRFSLLVDAGIRRCEDAAPIFDSGVQQLVAGLETLESPTELARLVGKHGPERIVFSLDLRHGKPLSNGTGWPAENPFEVASLAISVGCAELIVLDIAAVGTGGGVGTLGLCDSIRGAFPAVTLLTGGGVRGPEDLRTLDRAGIDGVLIASALHNGSIKPSDLDEFRKRAV